MIIIPQQNGSVELINDTCSQQHGSIGLKNDMSIFTHQLKGFSRFCHGEPYAKFSEFFD
jgi:hypothetical protein